MEDQQWKESVITLNTTQEDENSLFFRAELEEEVILVPENVKPSETAPVPN